MKIIAARVTILVTGVIWAFTLPAYPSHIMTKASLQEAKSTLVNIIVMKITGPDDTAARASVIEGGSCKIEDKKNGTTWAFFPSVDKKNSKNIILRVCQVSGTDSSERFEEIERVGISLGTSKNLHTNPEYKIEIEAIAKHIKDGQPFRMPSTNTGAAATSE